MEVDMVRKNYLFILFCMTLCTFNHLFSSKPAATQPDTTQNDFDQMPTNPQFRADEYIKTLEAKIEKAMDEYDMISNSEHNMLKQQTSAEQELVKDQEWLKTIINLKNALLKKTSEQLKNPNGPIHANQNDIDQVIEMLNLSIVGKILTYIETKNNEFYFQLPLQPSQLRVFNSSNKDVTDVEFNHPQTGIEMDTWTFKIVPVNKPSPVRKPSNDTKETAAKK